MKFARTSRLAEKIGELWSLAAFISWGHRSTLVILGTQTIQSNSNNHLRVPKITYANFGIMSPCIQNPSGVQWVVSLVPIACFPSGILIAWHLKVVPWILTCQLRLIRGSKNQSEGVDGTWPLILHLNNSFVHQGILKNKTYNAQSLIYLLTPLDTPIYAIDAGFIFLQVRTHKRGAWCGSTPEISVDICCFICSLITGV